VRLFRSPNTNFEATLEPKSAAEYAFPITITDDDPLTATFAESSRRLEIDEGAAVALTVAFDRASAGDVTLAYSITASGDLPPAYTDLSGGEIVVPAGQRSGVIRLRADSDPARIATAGRLTVAFGDVTADARGGRVSGVGEALIHVRYRQQARTLGVAAAAPAGAEGGVARFTVTLSGAAPAGRPVVAAWAVAGGDGNLASAADLTVAARGMLSFAIAGAQTVAIPIADDELNEAAETLRVELALVGESTDTALDADAAAATVTIDASDSLTVAIEGGRASESAGEAVFTVRASRRSAAAVTVTLALAAGRAVTAAEDGGQSDFTAPDNLTVTIPPGATRAFFGVPLTADALNEADEDFTAAIADITAGAAAGQVTVASARATATAVILDDDPVTATVTPPAPATAVEGGGAEFTVTLTGGEPSTPLRVFYSLGGADITAADIFDPGAGVLDFTLAQATAETPAVAFTVQLAAAHRFAFAAPPGRLAEGASAVFAVTRAGPALASGESLAVQWAYLPAGDAPAADCG